MIQGIQNIGILLFDDVELLDFAGPLQVFSSANYLFPDIAPPAETCGLKERISVAKSSFGIHPNCVLRPETDRYDLFLIPGGIGTRALLKDDGQLEQIEMMVNKSSVCCSVCTGSLILAKLGYLQGKSATTHYAAVELLRELDSSIEVDRTQRYIDHGHIIVSEGVSAGIDMSFYLLEKFYGRELSEEVRRYIEY